jgi:hypothetical protein
MHAATLRQRGAIANIRDSQPASTTDHQTQDQQRDCGGVAEFADPVFVEERIVQMCRDELDAVNLCIDMSRMSDETLCSRLGIDKGHWSRMRKGRAHFPTAKRIALMQLAGNWAPIQFELGVSGVGAALFKMWNEQRDEADRRKAEESRRNEGRQIQSAWKNYQGAAA